MLLLLVGTSAAARTCSPPGKTEGRCVELTADGSDEVSEVQISPGQPTTFLFDSDVRVNELTLENRERFAVAPVERILTLVPSERVRGERPSTLTVCFADDAAPACTAFRLVIHPTIGERQVDVFRHPRPVESFQAELKTIRKENLRLHEENKRLRTERNRPETLTDLLASGMMGEAGIPSRPISKHITEHKNNSLVPLSVWTFRAPGRFAIWLHLENPKGAKPWTPQGVKLVGPKGEFLDVVIWPAEPTILPEKSHYLSIEVMDPNAQTDGTFILKLWEADGQRTFVIGNVIFPVLE
jgi:uncharacterized protein (TIGR02268 family)